MTLRHLRIYVEVCRQSSMTIAAEKLYMAQPAVSLAISELEQYYGVRLFDRLSRRLYITEAGKQMLSYATHITSLFDKMEQELKDWDTIGILRIGTSITIGTCFMPGYVKAFNQRHPNINVKVLVSSSDIIEQKLLDNDLDFALIEGMIHSQNLMSESYSHDVLIPVCSAENPFAERVTVTPKEFVSQKLILRETGSGTRELIDGVMGAADIPVDPIWESTSTNAIIEAVVNNLGVTILPYNLVKNALHSGVLKKLTLEELEFTRSYNVIYHKNKYISASAKAFIDMCRETGDAQMNKNSNEQ